MSMRVMKVKYNARVKTQQVNARGQSALAFTRRGVKQGNCCNGGIFVPRAPSHQQGYGLYLKRATMGVGGGGGLASKVVYHQDENGNNVPVQKTLTYKRPQSGGVDGFSSSNHISNLRSKTLRCEYSTVDKDGNCKTIIGNGTSGGMVGQSQNKSAASHPCINVCSKNGLYTQNLGYLSASQQINKILSQRGNNPGDESTALTTNYESNMMKSSSDGTCG
jgi:hypothetical protein